MIQKVWSLLLILFGIYGAYLYVVLAVVSIRDTIHDFFSRSGELFDTDYAEHGPGPGDF